jgi:mannose-6-phosphate isomerase
MRPVVLAEETTYEERCLVACKYFLTRELNLKAGGTIHDQTESSCVILSSLGAEIQLYYGPNQQYCETLGRGQTMVLPAALGQYRIEGCGSLLRSYVPTPQDTAWQRWKVANELATSEGA